MPTDSSPGTTKAEKDRELTQAAFDMLLARLDPDREEAGRKYDEIRRKLTKFFEFWGSSAPEDYDLAAPPEAQAVRDDNTQME
jgi:hypothetical protein